MEYEADRNWAEGVTLLSGVKKSLKGKPTDENEHAMISRPKNAAAIGQPEASNLLQSVFFAFWIWQTPVATWHSLLELGGVVRSEIPQISPHTIFDTPSKLDSQA